MGAEPTQVAPRENASVVPIGEDRLDGVEADWLEGRQSNLTLAHLKHLLARAVALHLGRGAVDPHELKADALRLTREIELHLPGLGVDNDGAWCWSRAAAVVGRDLSCH